MASGDGDGSIFTAVSYGVLLSGDRGGRLYGGADDDGTSVADAAERPAGVVRLLPDAFLFGVKCVIIGAAKGVCRQETVPDLYAFYCADRHDACREGRIQFLKDRHKPR